MPLTFRTVSTSVSLCSRVPSDIWSAELTRLSDSNWNCSSLLASVALKTLYSIKWLSSSPERAPRRTTSGEKSALSSEQHKSKSHSSISGEANRRDDITSSAASTALSLRWIYEKLLQIWIDSIQCGAIAVSEGNQAAQRDILVTSSPVNIEARLTIWCVNRNDHETEDVYLPNTILCGGREDARLQNWAYK